MAQKTAPVSAQAYTHGSVEFLYGRGGRGRRLLGGAEAPDETAPILHGDRDDGAHAVDGVEVPVFGAVSWRNDAHNNCAN